VLLPVIEENRFEKILFPDKRKASSLYKLLKPKYYNNLNSKEVRKKIGIWKRGL
jgi:hypothetical protein